MIQNKYAHNVPQYPEAGLDKQARAWAVESRLHWKLINHIRRRTTTRRFACLVCIWSKGCTSPAASLILLQSLPSEFPYVPPSLQPIKRLLCSCWSLPRLEHNPSLAKPNRRWRILLPALASPINHRLQMPMTAQEGAMPSKGLNPP